MGQPVDMLGTRYVLSVTVVNNMRRGRDLEPVGKKKDAKMTHHKSQGSYGKDLVRSLLAGKSFCYLHTRLFLSAVLQRQECTSAATYLLLYRSIYIVCCFLYKARKNLVWYFITIFSPILAIFETTTIIITKGSICQENCEIKGIKVGTNQTSIQG